MIAQSHVSMDGSKASIIESVVNSPDLRRQR